MVEIVMQTVEKNDLAMKFQQFHQLLDLQAFDKYELVETKK